ncbi:hypothetical protein EMWEY_00013600 [Eimeria maxima]|uniref:Uncharacterized protein n=1 Tax=Eimeria maxima TaxID=5804 RepID=U6M2S4_EIMMA|nr:hypothetical protein EMWEY_00013600 [Eimeria maxima]CDJ55990.1 hypothetical protein EMWEY_00013600 [Eimeria maxima]
MVVTRQGTVTSAAGPPGGAAAAAAGAGADAAAAAAAKGRSPVKPAAQQRAPSKKKRGGGRSPAAPRTAAHRGAASPGGSPRSAGGGGGSPRVHIASRPVVLPSLSTSSFSSRRSPSDKPLIRGGPLKERQQTGPLPFVRQMSDMSDVEVPTHDDTEESLVAAPAARRAASTTRRRRGGGAVSGGGATDEGEITRQTSSSSSSSTSSNRSSSSRQSRPVPLLQKEVYNDPSVLGGIRSRSRIISSSSSSNNNNNNILDGSSSTCSNSSSSNSSSSSSSSSSISSSSTSRISEGKLGQLLLTYFCYASLYLTRKPFASCKREIEKQLSLSTAALGGIDTVFLSAYAASQLLLAPFLLGRAAAAAAATAAAATGAAATGAGKGGKGGGDPTAAAAAAGRAVERQPSQMQHQQEDKQQQQQMQQQQQQQQEKSLLLRVLGVGRFRRLCAAYFSVKLVRYALLYWLAYYLEQHAALTAAAAAFYCTYFDAGGVFGSVALGWFSDKYLRGRRVVLLSPLCCIAGVSLLLLHSAVVWGPAGDLGFAAQAALLLAGAAIAAPDSVLGAAAAADACAEEGAANDAAFAAAAACIVNGSGSVGSIVQGLLTPTLLAVYGWGGVFNFLAGISFLGAASLLPGAIKDYKFLRAAKKTA